MNPYLQNTTNPYLEAKENPYLKKKPFYGLRADKTSKGPGYFGELKRPDGYVSTELSIGVNFDGKETQIPTLVPTLNQQEINYLLSGSEPTKEIIDKAITHAKMRMSQGKSPFAQKGEQIISSEELFGKKNFLRIRSPKEAIEGIKEVLPISREEMIMAGPIPLVAKKPIRAGYEEAKEGIETIAEAAKTQYKKPKIIMPYGGFRGPEDVLRAGKAGLGALQALFAPLTGTTKTWIREPTEKAMLKMGASPTVSKVTGLGAEMIPYVATPSGAFKGTIGKTAREAVLPIWKRLAYGPRAMEGPITREWPQAVQNIQKALTEALPLRGKQATMYSEELGKRVGKITGIGEGMRGQKAYYAQLRALKGELPKLKKPEFESIAGKIKEKDVDDLLNMIEDAPHLLPLEKISAKEGLMELLAPAGGIVPQKSKIKLLASVFPGEFVKTILEKRPMLRGMKEMGIELINVPRTVMASMDLSAPFRQGIFVAAKHPVKFGKSFLGQHKWAFSEKAYRKVMKQIQEQPNFLLAKKSGVAFTDLGGLTSEEAYMGGALAEQLPFMGRIVRGSGRAYTGFLNKLRMDLFNDFVKKNPGIIRDAEGMKQLTAFLNAATGRGNLYGVFKSGRNLLNAGFFSPRLMSSRIKLLNPAYYVNPKLNPAVRKEAIKSLLSFTASGMTMMGVLTALGNRLGKNVKIGMDPRSANFGKIQVGNTRFDIWGGFQQYARLAGQLISGKMVSSTTGREYSLGEGYKPTTRLDIIYRFLESKENPILSFVTGVIRGQDFIGDEFDVPAETINRFVSMVAQDLYDLYREDKDIKDILWGLPAVYGVGMQTYGKRQPVIKATPSGKPTIKVENLPSLGEEVMNLIRGQKSTNIPEEAHERIIKAKDLEAQRKYEKQRALYKIQQKRKEALEEILKRQRRR